MDTSVPQAQPSSLLRKGPLLIAGVLLLVILAVWLVPKAFALYQQMKAGKIINGISQTNSTNTPNDLPCARAALTNSAEIDQVQIAIKRLSLALQLDSQFAKAQFLLGQAYCMTGSADGAVTAFEKYNQIRPRNPLGHIELALALEYRCISNLTLSGSGGVEKVNQEINFPYCGSEADTSRVIDEWKAAGVQPSQLAEAGDYNLKNKNYDEAIRWYQRSLLLEPTNNKTINDLGIICHQFSQNTRINICDIFSSVNMSNLFIDPDFLVENLTVWTPYEYNQSTRYTFAECPENKGSSCASIQLNGNVPDGGGIYQCLPLQPGQQYKYSAWIKVQVEPGGKWRPLYFQGNAQGNPVGRWYKNQYITGSVDWTYYEITFNSPDFDNHMACLHPIRLQSTGQAWFYSPRLEQVTEP